ncbi:MAG: hypothetical protein MI923_23350 [Phycisphaerales bacterium]|nr:hypothetical protein [Phycisphaerales bacterium]
MNRTLPASGARHIDGGQTLRSSPVIRHAPAGTQRISAHPKRLSASN